MTWSKYDDRYLNDPRVLALSRGVRYLRIEALAYCNEHNTDGRIARAALRRFSDEIDPVSAAGELVRVGVWETDGLDWIDPEFLKNQPSAADVERIAELSRDRQRKQRQHRNGDHSMCDPKFCQQAKTSRVTVQETTSSGERHPSVPKAPGTAKRTLASNSAARKTAGQGSREALKASRVTQRVTNASPYRTVPKVLGEGETAADAGAGAPSSQPKSEKQPPTYPDFSVMTTRADKMPTQWADGIHGGIQVIAERWVAEGDASSVLDRLVERFRAQLDACSPDLSRTCWMESSRVVLARVPDNQLKKWAAAMKEWVVSNEHAPDAPSASPAEPIVSDPEEEFGVDQ